MGKSLKVRRRYFTKAQKIGILNEWHISGVSLSELSRKYQVSPVVLYKWRKKMDREITASFPSPQCLVSELEKTRKENEYLKKALGELVVERQILKTANEVLKKRQIKKAFISRRRS